MAGICHPELGDTRPKPFAWGNALISGFDVYGFYNFEIVFFSEQSCMGLDQPK